MNNITSKSTGKATTNNKILIDLYTSGSAWRRQLHDQQQDGAAGSDPGSDPDQEALHPQGAYGLHLRGSGLQEPACVEGHGLAHEERC